MGDDYDFAEFTHGQVPPSDPTTSRKRTLDLVLNALSVGGRDWTRPNGLGQLTGQLQRFCYVHALTWYFRNSF